MAKDKIERIDDVQLEKISGGSLERCGDEFRVFNYDTGEDFGTYENYDDAVKEAKKHKISPLGTWQDDEPVAGKSYTRKLLRLYEDETGRDKTLL